MVKSSAQRESAGGAYSAEAGEAASRPASAATGDGLEVPFDALQKLAAMTRRRPVELIAAAKSQLHDLTGFAVDSVASFAKAEDGWELTVAVIELSRIPPSNDMLADYAVRLDGAGDIVEYRRTGRYLRNQARDAE